MGLSLECEHLVGSPNGKKRFWTTLRKTIKVASTPTIYSAQRLWQWNGNVQTKTGHRLELWRRSESASALLTGKPLEVRTILLTPTQKLLYLIFLVLFPLILPALSRKTTMRFIKNNFRNPKEHQTRLQETEESAMSVNQSAAQHINFPYKESVKDKLEKLQWGPFWSATSNQRKQSSKQPSIPLTCAKKQNCLLCHFDTQNNTFWNILMLC